MVLPLVCSAAKACTQLWALLPVNQSLALSLKRAESRRGATEPMWRKERKAVALYGRQSASAVVFLTSSITA